ncbi:MAG: hypothetical protein KJ634_11100 [Gammaproteobacteria bacterium]|nr:hypothetical protein [Gammaproteobacteria bacterium]MBU1416160.1 hypothetical protein [Gammaproteobacteria bacterium]
MTVLRVTWLAALLASVAAALLACGGGGSATEDPQPSAETRSFLMGSTPFFGSPTSFPDWRFENMGDRDLLSVHVDDFWGVPWDQCDASDCTVPSVWDTKWRDFATAVRGTGKTIFLTVSPLSDRKTLAKRPLANGALEEHWLPASVVDANGCYKFVEDAANAAIYKTAYISFLKYLIDLFQPTYLSPTAEMNMPFTTCPAQKAAWIAWYSDVYAAIKAAYPALIVFPTFQMEYMYGVAEPAAACASGTTDDECFDQHLAEALAIPADRIAFSTYPSAWVYSSVYGHSQPTDTYERVANATSRKIWVSETGWPAVPLLASYPHGSSGACGSELYPASLTVLGVGTFGLANDDRQAQYLSWLLGEAQNRRFEAVVWWLNRDYLDGTVASACPCTPSTSDTCQLADLFHTIGGDFGETMLRVFGNMALRYYDGSPRPGYTTWKQYCDRTYAP